MMPTLFISLSCTRFEERKLLSSRWEHTSLILLNTFHHTLQACHYHEVKGIKGEKCWRCIFRMKSESESNHDTRRYMSFKLYSLSLETSFQDISFAFSWQEIKVWKVKYQNKNTGARKTFTHNQACRQRSEVQKFLGKISWFLRTLAYTMYKPWDINRSDVFPRTFSKKSLQQLFWKEECVTILQQKRAFESENFVSSNLKYTNRTEKVVKLNFPWLVCNIKCNMRQFQSRRRWQKSANLAYSTLSVYLLYSWRLVTLFERQEERQSENRSQNMS